MESKSDSLEAVIYVCGQEPWIQSLPPCGTIRIGRSDTGNDITIRDTSVSRHHAILLIGTTLRIVDCNSRNGILVYRTNSDGTETTATNERRPVESIVRNASFDVGIGDRITIGSVVLIIRKCRPWRNESLVEGPTVLDPTMKAIYDDVRKVAKSAKKTPVLILGETGTGKEWIARTIHSSSPRSRGPFIAINCAALTKGIVESEIFGHIKGSFSGAIKDKVGLFELAHKGTLFLDEIAELPLDTQAKLLRVLETESVCRVGATQYRSVDVRIVAATKKDLHQAMLRGEFRDDLYYRLNGAEYFLPPLRERPSEIIPLAERFLLEEARQDNHKVPFRLTLQARDCLLRYHYPGNVRELQKAISIAAVRCIEGLILPEHLPPAMSGVRFRAIAQKSAPSSPEFPPGEKERILEALHRRGGNQKLAAMDLGIAYRTFVDILNRYPDIPRPKKGNRANAKANAQQVTRDDLPAIDNYEVPHRTYYDI